MTEIEDVSVEYGTALSASPSVPDRSGYAFDGWYLNEEEYVFGTTLVTEDITLKAHWTADYYTVIFNTVGGSSVPSLKIKNGERINLVSEPEPTREGYVFNGWKSSDGSYFNFSTMITSSITLKADWISESDIATVTLKDSSGYIIRKDTVMKGNTYTIPDLGYEIKSCTDDDNNTITGSVTIEKNTVLTITKGKYKEYEIGDIGPGGGYIVFDADYKGSDKTYLREFKGYSSSKLGWRYLEAAESDLYGSYIFGYYRESGTNSVIVSENDGKEIGKGRSNTASLVEKMGKTSLNKDSGEDEDAYAAYAAQSYDGGGFLDWFLPSIKELGMLKLLNKKSLGDVKMGNANNYWSSTENDGTKANSKSFVSAGVISGYNDARSKNNYVRPFRCF